MAPKILHIPDGTSKDLHVGDELDIIVTKTCTWCYEYPDNVFDSMLPAGTYTVETPHHEYGPYKAANKGTMKWNAVTSGDCSTDGLAEVPRSITVS